MFDVQTFRPSRLPFTAMDNYAKVQSREQTRESRVLIVQPLCLLLMQGQKSQVLLVGQDI